MKIHRLKQKLKAAKNMLGATRKKLEAKLTLIEAEHEYILHLKRLEQIALGR